MIRYNTAAPEVVELPQLEVGETLYDAHCDWRTWMGLSDDLFEVDRVFDPAEIDVQPDPPGLTTSGLTFTVTAVGAVPANQDSYTSTFQLRGRTISGQVIGPVQYSVKVIPSFGAAQP